MAAGDPQGLDIEVGRDELTRVRALVSECPRPRAGEALLRVERFGLSANNITYARLGDSLGYWAFFPAAEDWGRIPVWGFAEVIDSAAEGLGEGVRVFGYLPMSSHLVVAPRRVGEAGFSDGAAHRAQLPPAYNAYRRVDSDPGYEPGREPEQMLLRPLFLLSFLFDDFLADNELFGAETVVLSSASSKAALGIAFLLTQRGVAVTGLTSAGKVEALERLSVYSRVLAYESVDELERTPAVFADLAGNAEVRAAVHARLGAGLRHSAAVGVTHGGAFEGAPDAVPFFVPDRIRARTRDWGGAGFDERLGVAWRPFVEWCDGWLEIEHGHGPRDVEAAYRQVLEGRAAPETAHVLSL